LRLSTDVMFLSKHASHVYGNIQSVIEKYKECLKKKPVTHVG